LTFFLLDHIDNRTMSSIHNMNDKSEETLVIGHRNPDTDAITAAIVYADFLCRMKVKATAYRLGDLNNETKFVLKSAGVKEPEMIPDNVPEGTQVALVDHNESKKYDLRILLIHFFSILGQQSMEGLKKMRVTHVVDHHKLGDLTTSDPVYLRFEPVGCTATILTKLFRENNQDIDQKLAFLLISAVLSDTLHFQ
jgi:manganese-dependent inorganic pyrophosphatase